MDIFNKDWSKADNLNINMLENLAVDLQAEILDKLEPEKIRDICKEFSQIKYNWKARATRDFNYPSEAYKYSSDMLDVSTPIDIYFKIQSMIPTFKKLDTLYCLSQLWCHEYNKPLKSQNLDILVKERDSGPAMTQEDAENFMECLKSTLYESFISCNYLYLHAENTYYINCYINYDVSYILTTQKYTSIIRGQCSSDVTYKNILKQIRAFFPICHNGSVVSFSFGGFNPEGIPILNVITEI